MPGTDTGQTVSCRSRAVFKRAVFVLAQRAEPIWISIVTPHCLFLSYQPEPGAKMLHPEVYPRPNGTPLPLVNFSQELLS
jgi:hypothetical protein